MSHLSPGNETMRREDGRIVGTTRTREFSARSAVMANFPPALDRVPPPTLNSSMGEIRDTLGDTTVSGPCCFATAVSSPLIHSPSLQTSLHTLGTSPLLCHLNPLSNHLHHPSHLLRSESSGRGCRRLKVPSPTTLANPTFLIHSSLRTAASSGAF